MRLIAAPGFRCPALDAGNGGGADLHLPSPEIRTKYRRFFEVGQLMCHPLVAVSAEEQSEPAAVSSHVANPLPLPSG